MRIRKGREGRKKERKEKGRKKTFLVYFNGVQKEKEDVRKRKKEKKEGDKKPWRYSSGNCDSNK